MATPKTCRCTGSKVTGQGLPHYVNGRLATDSAHGGRYSFRFDLNGGSLVYRYEPGLLKVRPGVKLPRRRRSAGPRRCRMRGRG